MKRVIMQMSLLCAIWVVLLSVGQGALAGTAAGMNELGGNASWSQSTFDHQLNGVAFAESEAETWSLSPSYGRFLSDKLEVRGTLSYNKTKSEIASADGQANSEVTASVYYIQGGVVYHFNPESKHVWFVSGEVGFGSGEIDEEWRRLEVEGKRSFSTDGLVYTLAVGVKSFISEQAAITVQYAATKPEFLEEYYEEEGFEVDTDWGPSLAVGLNLYF